MPLPPTIAMISCHSHREEKHLTCFGRLEPGDRVILFYFILFSNFIFNAHASRSFSYVTENCYHVGEK